jgi:hypothetical protein
MKVIFLDHDGVICLPQQQGGRFKKQKKAGFSFSNDPNMPVECRFDNFDPKAVKILNEILEKTGAEIVVSSDWRNHATLEEMGEYYLSKGIAKKPIGYTELFKGNHKGWREMGYVPDEFPWHRMYDLEQERSLEILRWLKDNPGVTHWLAIDDLQMGKFVNVSRSRIPEYQERDWGLTNFYLSNLMEGLKKCGAKEKIIKYLND